MSYLHLDNRKITIWETKHDCVTVMILSFKTDRSGQTVQTQIRPLLEEQSDQGLYCLLAIPQTSFDKIPYSLSSLTSLFEF